MRVKQFLNWGVKVSVVCTLLGFVILQCKAVEQPQTATMQKSSSAGVVAWQVVYKVLQHPRCLNCHPAGDRPLQGDASRVHAQNVQRGEEGMGITAMRCTTCHQTQNLAAEHLPPGAPKWHMPSAAEPLIFQGRSSAELCLQLRDPKHNGAKTPEQLFDHVAHDALVLWGWDPGSGRTPVDTPHGEFVQAMRTWIESGCNCPSK